MHKENETYRRVLNKLGYYDYQRGLIFRHLSQQGGWDSHLEKCRRFILNAAEHYKPSKVTVMGSGWLIDLPLTELLERVHAVVLTDIVHPPDVKKQLSGLTNVHLLEDDLTGGLIANVWKEAKKTSLINKIKTIRNIEIPEYAFADDPGLLISLNILSQLHVLPERYLRKKSRAGEEEYEWFRKTIQQRHLDLLNRHNSVLITDTTEVFTDRSGDITDEKSVFVSLPEGKLKEEWTWDFDLKGSDFYEKRSVMKVTAVMI